MAIIFFLQAPPENMTIEHKMGNLVLAIPLIAYWTQLYLPEGDSDSSITFYNTIVLILDDN